MHRDARAPGESGRGAALVWAVFLAAVVLIVNRPWQSSSTPAASGLSEGDFSAERAWTHVEMLASKIGRRVTGTEASVRAAGYIEQQLRGLGVETVRQAASGSMELDLTTYVYRGVQNVLARVPGTRASATLVSAHYDSGVEGPGAGDNAINVAAALEIVRATLSGDMPANTIIFNFNDGEELGLLGAAAFLQHPWFKEITTFVNLDASGPGGRQLLLQVSPGRDDLLEAYAAAAPHPHGTVLAQEVFQTLPFDTDYQVYRAAGLGGIDLAPYGDGYAYHTLLDGTGRLSRRTLQEGGENILALLRAMDARSPVRADADAAPAVYYDILGLIMVRYPAGTARAMALLVAALALAAVFRSGTGTARVHATIAPGSAAVVLATVFGVLLPIAGSLLVTAAGRGMFWYARPWTALCVYGTLAAAGVFAAYAVLRRLLRHRALRPRARRAGDMEIPGESPASVRGAAPPEVDPADAWRRGLIVFWTLLLLVTTALQLGSAYLPLWWCAGATAALVSSAHLTGATRWLATLAGVAPAAIMTMQAADLLLTSIVPLTGMLGAGTPADVLIAAITALAVVPFAIVIAPVGQLPPSPARVGAWSAAVVMGMAVVVAGSFPYTPERPKRTYLDVRSGGEDRAHVAIEATDSGPDLAIKDVGLDGVIARPAPAIDVVPATAADPPTLRAVEIRLTAPGAYLVDVAIEGGTISRPRAGEAAGRHLVWVGTDDPITVGVDRAAGSPVSIHARAFYIGSDLSVDHVLAQLPRWSTPTVQTVLETSVTF